MTLTAADIGKINRLYVDLERLHDERNSIKDATFEEVSGKARRGTSGIEQRIYRDFSPEAAKEIKDTLARDIRRRAAKIVEALHKFGCEASLTEE